jgi:uncharacterized OB-fold protein
MLIVPKPDRLTAPYWEGARQGRLLLQSCGGCGHVWHPPLPICPQCRAKNYTWQPARGGGVVYSFTIVHHAAHVAVDGRTPYLVALVTLDEGPRVVGNILGCAIGDMRIGMKVSVTFQTIAPGVVLPQFEPAT